MDISKTQNWGDPELQLQHHAAPIAVLSIGWLESLADARDQTVPIVRRGTEEPEPAERNGSIRVWSQVARSDCRQGCDSHHIGDLNVGVAGSRGNCSGKAW